MNKLLSWAVLAVLLMSCNARVNGQTTNVEDDAMAQRKDRILENLKYQIPQLRELSVMMGDITSSDIEGLDQGTFSVNGQQTYKYLITKDDKSLYLLAADPIDVSLSKEDIAAAMEEERQAAAAEARERQAELAAFARDWPVRGNPNAPVTIVEFSDFQCPYCARGFTTVEQLLKKYPDDVKFVYLHFPLTMHPWAKPAAIAAVCAAQQDPAAFWSLHDSYFQNQRTITPTNVLEKTRGFLADTGIDLDTWHTCASDTASDAYQGALMAVENSMAAGTKNGVSGTPGFFVNGHFVNGAQSLETFEAVIAQAKQEAMQ